MANVGMAVQEDDVEDDLYEDGEAEDLDEGAEDTLT